MYELTEKDAYDRSMNRVDFNTQMREVERLRKKLAKRAKESKSPKKAAPAPALWDRNAGHRREQLPVSCKRGARTKLTVFPMER